MHEDCYNISTNETNMIYLLRGRFTVLRIFKVEMSGRKSRSWLRWVKFLNRCKKQTLHSQLNVSSLFHENKTKEETPRVQAYSSRQTTWKGIVVHSKHIFQNWASYYLTKLTFLSRLKRFRYIPITSLISLCIYGIFVPNLISDNVILPLK